MAYRTGGAFLLACAIGAVVACRPGNATSTATEAAERPAQAAAALLPPRLFDCRLRRIVNFDPDKNQTPSELVYDGRYTVALFLPPIPVRTSPPPQAPQPAEPVDPRTRVVADPDHLFGTKVARFDRVVDLWPQRVEMTAPISSTAVKLVVLTPDDTRGDRATIFLANANDAVTYDRANLYSGECTISPGPKAS